MSIVALMSDQGLGPHWARVLREAAAVRRRGGTARAHAWAQAALRRRAAAAVLPALPLLALVEANTEPLRGHAARSGCKARSQPAAPIPPVPQGRRLHQQLS